MFRQTCLSCFCCSSRPSSRHKLIASQHYKRYRRRIMIEFHSPTQFTLTTTQYKIHRSKNFKLLQNDPDTNRIFSQPPLIHSKNFKLLQNDPDTDRIFSQPLISFKRDKNIVRSVFQTSDQPGTFKRARARCKTCSFIRNVEKISGPKRSIKIISPVPQPTSSTA